MNKKYCSIAVLSFISLVSLIIGMFFISSSTYITMASIFIPILAGIIINYDNKQKEIYKLYYLPLYHYIKTYYDILSQPDDMDPISKKHEMMSSISKDLIGFLTENLKYSSEELSDMLSIIHFYKYENQKEENEFQDVYNINKLIPIITKELLEIYNVLHITDYFKRKKYLNKKYHMVNGIIYLYVDGFLMDIGRRKEYTFSLAECVEFYKNISDYRKQHFKDYHKIYRYIKRNKNKDIELLIEELKAKFNIDIKKYSSN